MVKSKLFFSSETFRDIGRGLYPNISTTSSPNSSRNISADLSLSIRVTEDIAGFDSSCLAIEDDCSKSALSSRKISKVYFERKKLIRLSVLDPAIKKAPRIVKLIRMVKIHKKFVNLFLEKLFNPSAKRKATLSIIRSPFFLHLAL